MRITSSRKEDLIRQRDEYKRKKAAQDERKERDYDRYRADRDEILGGIESILLYKLNKFKRLNFRVHAEEYYGGDSVRIQINCDDRLYGDAKEQSALAWDYNATLTKEGELKLETGSWSGLKATTADQIASLKESVEAIEMLYNMGDPSNSDSWYRLLNVELPQYSDYYTPRENLNPDNIDFDKEIFIEELKEVVGKKIGIRGMSRTDGSRWSHSQEGYYFVTKLSPKTVSVKFISDRSLGYYEGDIDKALKASWDEGMRINTLYEYISSPIETKEF